MAKLLTTARIAGHEFLIALPLEPSGYPLSDPGPETLLTTAAWPENETKLRWALSRIDGYAGATGVIGGMMGERLAQMPDQMEGVLSELSARGLFYVDPRARPAGAESLGPPCRSGDRRSARPGFDRRQTRRPGTARQRSQPPWAR